jgi:CHAD domain-containing protein
MSLKIKDLGQLDQGVKTVLRKECDHLVATLEEGTETTVHTTVHEVRKRCKKIRGILRLVRNSLGDYHAENHFFRDEARKLSDLRDTTALIEALDICYAQYGDKLYKNAFNNLRESLLHYREDRLAQFFSQKDILKEIKRNIKAKRDGIHAMNLQIEDYSDVAPNLKRVYERGRNAYKAARESKRPEDFHEWRKRVKYLRYQLRALQAAWPGIFVPWEDELHALSDLLGTDRDLFMLQHHLFQHPKENLQETMYLAADLIKGQRNQLQQHALLQGARLYELKPKAFVMLILTSIKGFLELQQPRVWPKSHLES